MMTDVPKKRLKSILIFFFYVAAVLLLTKTIYAASQQCHNCVSEHTLNLSGGGYNDENMTSLWQQLSHRIQVQPFNLMSLILFACAIIHTFIAPKINALSNQLRQYNIDNNKEIIDSFGVEILRFMGEVEVIFGIWVVPLLIAMTLQYDWITALHYLSSRDYTEPTFVVVIMALASSLPVVRLAENVMKYIARLGGQSVQAWWLCILILGPLSGSLITEPGAMTISSMLLAKQFYNLGPSRKLAYSTLGLLFVNVSVGGVFTSFAAPPVLMVSKVWGWDTPFMFSNFGLKAALGILISTIVYYFVFRKELQSLEEKRQQNVSSEQKAIQQEQKIPFWISLTHLTILAWMVVHSHYPVMFIGSFLIFIGFHKATLPYQSSLSLKTPVLVGFFLAGLVVHGSLQAWWITPVLGKASCAALMFMSTVLTAFNDNAEITFLASLIPTFSDAMKYAVVAGAVTGGGLTVIANAPNPLGQALLGKFFRGGVHPVNLFLSALIPTLIVGACFWLLRPLSC
ncbi:MAG: putative Na+/H+ antiporter [Chlamydiota bacterium]|nr:putative Na+/H+ antiporter [Chlamydiota bacterium]